MSLLWKRNWCLPEGVFQSNILMLEKYSQCCPNMPQNWRRAFSALSWLCQTCSIATSSDVGWFIFFFFGGLGNPFVFLCAQLPENPFRKYISIQDMDGNKEYFRCGLSVGAAGPLSSETFPLLAACAVGCSPAPHARSSSWNVAFGFGARGNRPVMI